MSGGKQQTYDEPERQVREGMGFGALLIYLGTALLAYAAAEVRTLGTTTFFFTLGEGYACR